MPLFYLPGVMSMYLLTGLVDLNQELYGDCGSQGRYNGCEGHFTEEPLSIFINLYYLISVTIISACVLHGTDEE